MSVAPAFDQNIIAVVWDFDKTLIQGYMQEPLFRAYGVDSRKFWEEVGGLEEHYRMQGIRVNRDTIYLNHLLTYVLQGPLAGLNNERLRNLGKELVFFPGLPEFLSELRNFVENDPKYRAFGIHLEHYVVSTGFAETIKGSAIAPFVHGIWGCEFAEDAAPKGYLQGLASSPNPKKQITQVVMALDNTSKTRFLFEINKGANLHPEIDVNSTMENENRRVPFPHMIYIADGPSDVPAFSIVNLGGGLTYAVYSPSRREGFLQVNSLLRQGRIQMYGPADYSEGSQTRLWLVEHVRMIADSIVARRQENIRASASAPPRHLEES